MPEAEESTRKKVTREEVDAAKHELEIWSNREKRLRNRERFVRSADDRKRTHRLIQYGVMFERCHRELEVLTDQEIYQLVEGLLQIPEAEAQIAAAVAGHKDDSQEGET